MGYLTELRDQWRPLTAALIGLGSGFSFTTYTTSIMAPQLIQEFGWTRAEFASVGALSLIMVIVFPFVGRLTDTIGVRRTALIGVISLPLTFIGYSTQNGDLGTYSFWFLAQALLCIPTTATVYSRIVVQYITKARGLALAIVASGPAITGAILGPMLNTFVAAHGWREGYWVLAAFTGLVGLFALLLMPPERKNAETAPAKRSARGDYAIIFGTPAFWLMLVALFLCNFPQTLALTQLNLMLQENGVTLGGASVMISAFSMGMLAGRFLCGLALDRFPAQIVAAIGLGVPSIGLFLIASSLDDPMVLTLSVLLFGLSFGAEGDLIGYLIARNFGVGVYSSVMGLMTAVISTSVSLGALFLSYTLSITNTFVLFLTISGAAVIVGSLLFLFLRPRPELVEAAAESSVSGPA